MVVIRVPLTVIVPTDSPSNDAEAKVIVMGVELTVAVSTWSRSDE